MAKEYYSVLIPKKQVNSQRNKNGNYFWLISIPGTTKEVFIPHEWLRLSSNGKYYRGSFPRDKNLLGRRRVSIQLNSSSLEGVYPSTYGVNVKTTRLIKDDDVDDKKTCPKCGNKMVRVTQKRNPGVSFLGCSNYPKCKYSEDLQKL